MRPFGNDITNIPNGGNNGGNNGSNNGNNDPNDGNDNRNTNISSEDPSEESGLSDDPSIPPHIARIGGIVTCPRSLDKELSGWFSVAKTPRRTTNWVSHG